MEVASWRLVYLKLQPHKYKLKSLAKKRNEKLSLRLCGPYKITKCICQVAYQLDLPLESKDSFDIPCFPTKEGFGTTCESPSFPIMLTEDIEFQVEPEMVLATLTNH